MAHLYFQLQTVEKFWKEAFLKFGFSEKDSAIITDVLLMSDRDGNESNERVS